MPGKVLTVEFVTPESRIWSGEATMLSARTLDGDLGIMPDHAPLFGVLV
ncbi:MAG: F0F1 ATP synthase subunit epsilon, partial [Actinobacteria bacterium]|nr:F0F1 ATP synthase subunit epsilon [Actinomycetota bacterium]